MQYKSRNINKVYEGETARSARVRGSEHWQGLKNKNNSNVLYKHKVLEHRNEEVQYQMEITNKFNDALTRQANEAVRINNRNADELMNGRNEFNHPPLARIRVDKF